MLKWLKRLEERIYPDQIIDGVRYRFNYCFFEPGWERVDPLPVAKPPEPQTWDGRM
jgi:hypothetical protein